MSDLAHEVFVSYAHADDERPTAAAKGWVTTLVDELKKVLRRKVGRGEPRIFMDHHLAGNEPVTPALLNALRASRTLLLLMSPGYRKSNWCQWELGQFLAAETERNHKDHVFVLETEPVDRKDWHPALQNLIPVRFWHREFEDKAPRLMGFPTPKADEDNPYWRNLNELAHLIAGQLEEPSGPPSPPRPKVWLAEPTEDLLDEHESFAAALRQQGFDVVPAAPLPRDGKEPYFSALAASLEPAILAVQLLGPKEGRLPAWGDRSFVALQAEAADEAARSRGLRIFRWRPREVDPLHTTSASYRALLSGGTVRAQGLEELKQEILQALLEPPRVPPHPAPVASTVPSGPVATPRVYVNSLAVDLDRGKVQTPYPGLRPFEIHEAAIFFGRESHTDRLLEILQRERFLAVLGPSGAGKSSLIRAGFLPGLAADRFGGTGDWRVAILRPGERPFQRLAEALAQSGALGPAEGALASLAGIEAELRRGPLGLAQLVEDARRSATGATPFRLLVLVDQFEEIFRYAQAGYPEADESAAFIHLLLATRGAPTAGVYVALTMRTDFLGHCVRFHDLPEAINRAQYLVPRLTRAELERAITGPALVFGGDVAPELVAELINSLDQDFDQLPLLQHALSRMWNAASTGGGSSSHLTPASLVALGGLQGALSAHAEEVYGRLSAREQTLAESLFRAITLREGAGQDSRSTRRPQRLQQIADIVECYWRDLEPVVRSFAAEGVNFLHHGEPLGPNSVIDISHEALIRQWDRLREWADDEARREAELRTWLDRAEMRKQGGELLTGADLARAAEWFHGGANWSPTRRWATRYLDPAATAGFDETLGFVAKSEAAEDERRKIEALKVQEQERLERNALEARAEANRVRAEAAARERDQARRFSRIAMITAIVMLSLGVVAWVFALRAGRAAQESQVRQIASEASSLGEAEPDRSQLLAVEAFLLSETPISDVALRQAYSRNESLLRTYRGHKFAVQHGEFSHDGHKVLTAGNDNTAQLWEASTGRTLLTFTGHSKTVNSAVFSADDRTVLTASNDGSARLWDAISGHLLQTFLGHEGAVFRAVFSPNGRTALTIGQTATAHLWDLKTGQVLQVLHEDPGTEFFAAAFGPDGRTVLTSRGTVAHLWDADTGQTIQSFRGHEGGIFSVALSPDGRSVLTASYDKTARLWDSVTGKALQTFRGHDSGVYSAAFSPNHETILTAGADLTARLWSMASGSELKVLRGHEGQLTLAEFSPDGQTVLTASYDRTARIWNTATGQLLQILRGHQDTVIDARFSPDGRLVLTAGGDSTARLWVVDSVRELRLDDFKVRAHSAALSPNGQYALTTHFDKTARLWSVASGRQLKTLSGHGEPITSAVFNADGHSILTASQDQTARVWNAATGETVQILRGHTDSVNQASFGGDGHTVLTASADQTARLWSLRTGKCLLTLRGHERSVNSATMTPDGRMIATASDDGSIRLWDAATARTLRVLEGHKGPVAMASFSPDGRYLLTSEVGTSARIWEVASGQTLHTLDAGRRGRVRAVFSGDGRTIVTASGETIRLWDTATGRLLKATQIQDSSSFDSISSLSFSPTGSTFVTTDSHFTRVRTWPCNVCRPTKELADEILRRVGRNLTPEERAQSGLPLLPVGGH